jgi:murein DD-endopeptidase MepM/ murein hydrolase activator NlpD
MEHYYISSPYGKRKHPVTGKYRMHHGIDLAGTWQENVSVSADGTVVFAGYHGSFGKVIRIRHNFGIITTYGHLARINVKRGDIVSEGQVIGKMGKTGRVNGAHLHYEISVNGKSQNPKTFIKIGRNLLSRTSLKNFANIK